MPDEIASLETLSAAALQRPAAQPVIEFQGEWRTWGEIRRVAERLAESRPDIAVRAAFAARSQFAV